MEAVLFIGIQAAGKSSFYLEQFFRTHVRVNGDMLQTRNREELLVQACLIDGSVPDDDPETEEWLHRVEKWLLACKH